MGCSASTRNSTVASIAASDISDPSRRHAEIERELQQYKNLMKRVVKLLLLGAGESGKSTILKQIRYSIWKKTSQINIFSYLFRFSCRILHAEGFNDDDLTTKRHQIIWNIYESVYAMVDAMEPLGLQYANPELLQVNTICKPRIIAGKYNLQTQNYCT